jgi:hypothetical protein
MDTRIHPQPRADSGKTGVQPTVPAMPNPPRAYVDPYKIGPDTFCISWDEHGKSYPCRLEPIIPRALRAEDV